MLDLLNNSSAGNSSRTRDLRARSGSTALCAAFVFAMGSPAFAQTSGSHTFTWNIKEKATKKEKKDPIVLRSGDRKTQGTHTVLFFKGEHPKELHKDTYEKKLLTVGDNLSMRTMPASMTFRGGPDKHTTTGTATFDVDLKYLKDKDGNWEWVNKIGVSATLIPGTEGKDVSIKVSTEDPFVFGSGPDAHFDYEPDGFNHAFSIAMGTAFPSSYAAAVNDPGAIASQTWMDYQRRVAPGSHPGVSDFWDAMPTGGLDLFSLRLSPNQDASVNADLVFAASTDDFALTYFGPDGLAFDPFANPGVVDALEALIAGSFVDGVLMQPLDDLFSVTFDPLAESSAFTVGNAAGGNLGAYEPPIPAPGAAVLFLFGFSLAVCRRR